MHSAELSRRHLKADHWEMTNAALSDHIPLRRR
jgi:hypothetical protein